VLSSRHCLVAAAAAMATAALHQAELRLFERPSAKTSALVAALRKRYAVGSPADYAAKKHELDLSYADAMR
jgi:hypothetical protein